MKYHLLVSFALNLSSRATVSAKKSPKCPLRYPLSSRPRHLNNAHNQSCRKNIPRAMLSLHHLRRFTSERLNWSFPRRLCFPRSCDVGQFDEPLEDAIRVPAPPPRTFTPSAVTHRAWEKQRIRPRVLNGVERFSVGRVSCGGHWSAINRKVGAGTSYCVSGPNARRDNANKNAECFRRALLPCWKKTRFYFQNMFEESQVYTRKPL